MRHRTEFGTSTKESWCSRQRAVSMEMNVAFVFGEHRRKWNEEIQIERLLQCNQLLFSLFCLPILSSFPPSVPPVLFLIKLSVQWHIWTERPMRTSSFLHTAVLVQYRQISHNTRTLYLILCSISQSFVSYFCVVEISNFDILFNRLFIDITTTKPKSSVIILLLEITKWCSAEVLKLRGITLNVYWGWNDVKDVIFAIQKFVVLVYRNKLSLLGTRAHFLLYLDTGGRSFWSFVGCRVGLLFHAQVDWDLGNLEARSGF